MSEVTELTNEQLLIQLVKEAGIGCDVCIDPLYKELLRRLSTQGAGPRPKEIRKWLTDNYPDISPNEHVELIAMLSNFGSEFFRAPSDPPRPETGTFIRKLRHKDGCTWATELPTGGGQYWGCNCGLDNVLIHLEDYEVKAVDEHGGEVKR